MSHNQITEKNMTDIFDAIEAIENEYDEKLIDIIGNNVFLSDQIQQTSMIIKSIQSFI